MGRKSNLRRISLPDQLAAMEQEISALRSSTSQLNKNAESVTERFVTEIVDSNQATNNQEKSLEVAIKSTDNVSNNSCDLFAQQGGIELGGNEKMTQLRENTSNVLHDSNKELWPNNSTSLTDVGCSSSEDNTILNDDDFGGYDRSTGVDNILEIANLPANTESSASNQDTVDIKSKITDERRSNEPSFDDAQEMQTLHQELQIITKQTQEHIENADRDFLMVNIERNVDDQMLNVNEQSLQGSESLPIIVASDDEVEFVCVKMNNSANSPNKQRDNTSQDENSPESGLECDSNCSIKPNGRKEGNSSPRDHVCSICLDEFDNKSFLDQCFHIL